MELLRTVKRKSFFSEVVYHLLNISLALVLSGITLMVQSPVAAVVLVILSKWRVLAVRPRFWWTNIQSNLVDLIVGLSVVALLYLSVWNISVQIAFTAFYIIWLVVIKPMSKRWQMMLQSAIAILFGTVALFSIGYLLPDIAVVAGSMIIGYSAARHFLVSYKEDQTVLLSSIWGIMFAEIGWLAYYWTFAYAIPGLTMIKLPQVTIILLLISFLGERVYRSWKKNGAVVRSEIMPPVLFSVAVIGVILLFFNTVTRI